MNYSSAILLADPSVRAVKGCYDPEAPSSSKRNYIFKTLDKSLKVGDLVVVPTETRHGFTVFKLEQVDVLIDPSSDVELKWVVGRVDLDAYRHTMAEEDRVIQRLRAAEHRKLREEMRKALFEGHEDEAKMLTIAPMSVTQHPAGTPHPLSTAQSF